MSLQKTSVREASEATPMRQSVSLSARFRRELIFDTNELKPETRRSHSRTRSRGNLHHTAGRRREIPFQLGVVSSPVVVQQRLLFRRPTGLESEESTLPVGGEKKRQNRDGIVHDSRERRTRDHEISLKKRSVSRTRDNGSFEESAKTSEPQ